MFACDKPQLRRKSAMVWRMLASTLPLLRVDVVRLLLDIARIFDERIVGIHLVLITSSIDPYPKQ
jgi:hypothetical protein